MQTTELEKQVVIVEDDPTFLSFWKRLLSQMGIENYVTFSDSSEAMLFFKEQTCRLLISDIVMPASNGYELAKLAASLNPDCEVVLTTAYGTDLTRFDIRGCHFHLLHKPYADISSLSRFIKYMLTGKDSSTYQDFEDEMSSENKEYPDVIEWKI